MILRYFLNSRLLPIISLLLIGCSRIELKPIYKFNNILSQSNESLREPNLGKRWLAALVNNKGKERIELIDLRSRRIVFLPGINRSDAQPISVSVSANGEIIAFIRQREDKTELLVYRRNLGTIRRIEITPKGIPRRVSLDGSGKLLAVQVSRKGRWDVDLIRL